MSLDQANESASIETLDASSFYLNPFVTAPVTDTPEPAQEVAEEPTEATVADVVEQPEAEVVQDPWANLEPLRQIAADPLLSQQYYAQQTQPQAQPQASAPELGEDWDITNPSDAQKLVELALKKQQEVWQQEQKQQQLQQQQAQIANAADQALVTAVLAEVPELTDAWNKYSAGNPLSFNEKVAVEAVKSQLNERLQTFISKTGASFDHAMYLAANRSSGFASNAVSVLVPDIRRMATSLGLGAKAQPPAAKPVQTLPANVVQGQTPTLEQKLASTPNLNAALDAIYMESAKELMKKRL